MRLFQHKTRQETDESRRIYALFEIAYTIVDFIAAICFLIGSILFFYANMKRPPSGSSSSVRPASVSSPPSVWSANSSC